MIICASSGASSLRLQIVFLVRIFWCDDDEDEEGKILVLFSSERCVCVCVREEEIHLSRVEYIFCESKVTKRLPLFS